MANFDDLQGAVAQFGANNKVILMIPGCLASW